MRYVDLQKCLARSPRILALLTQIIISLGLSQSVVLVNMVDIDTYYS